MHKSPKLLPPDNVNQVLLLTCCAPCAAEPITTLINSNIEPIVFFNNPNIQPKEEHELRKSEVLRLCKMNKLTFIEDLYQTDKWFEIIKGLENEDEKGRRCSICFEFRMQTAFEYADKNAIKVITSTLGMSRWKNMDQVNQAALKVAAKYSGLEYWNYNWRKMGGQDRMNSLIKKYNLYVQNYCGCIFSIKDSYNAISKPS